MSGRAARVLAQAKVNLFLRVLAREESGYHQIETLFCRLDLGDDVVVRTGGRGRALDCRGAEVGPVERNLAYRAALAYAEARGWPRAFAIEIDKRIPVGGGLGGGSADAGAVLRCLNALARRPLTPAQLLELAARIGADVPFLTLEAPLALAWGRGERLLALPPLPTRNVALICFAQGVATADAYAWLAKSRGAYVPSPTAWVPADFASWARVAAFASNDFEPVVAAHHAGVRDALHALRRIARRASRELDTTIVTLMSGSGATLFSIVAEASPGFTLIVDAPHAPRDPHGEPRLLSTATAGRVAQVEVID